MSEIESATETGTEDTPALVGATRQHRILDVAAREFSQKGYAGVRIDEIASAAGCNKQLIYYYFQNKAGLYDAVLERMVSGMVPVWEAMESANLEAALMKMVNQGGGMWRRLLTWEGLEYGADEQRDIRLVVPRTRAWSRPVEILRRAQERGEISSELDAEMLALAVVMFSMASHVLPQVSKMISGSDPESDEFAERQQEFLRVLIRSLSPAPVEKPGSAPQSR